METLVYHDKGAIVTQKRRRVGGMKVSTYLEDDSEKQARTPASDSFRFI
jgi:hypothetical protein